MSSVRAVGLGEFESSGRAGQSTVAAEVMRSLRTGFVYLGHDLPVDLLDEAYGLLEQFFALPQEEKDACAAPGSHGSRGYTSVMVETAESSDVADWKEMLNWGAALPAGHPEALPPYDVWHRPSVFPPGTRRALEELHDRLVDVQRRFLRIVAVGLGAHSGFFDSMTQFAPHLTRAIRYPSMSAAPAADGSCPVWAAAHADINLTTALPRATDRGLQIRLPSSEPSPADPAGAVGAAGGEGEWVDAAPPDGHVILNTGLMMERVSNDLVPAGYHRVVADPSQTGDRISVVQFCHPRSSAVLQPLPSAVSRDWPCRYHPTSAHDALSEVVWAIAMSD